MDSLLFSAPLDFDLDILPEFKKVLQTEYRHITRASQIIPNKNVVAWVPDPSQGFVIDDRVLDKLPCLRVIVTPSTGTNHIDRAACKERGIEVLCLLDVRDDLSEISASAEFTFWLLLAMFKVRPPRRELQGKHIGVIGLGRIGKRIKEWCDAFDVAEVSFHDPHVPGTEPLRRLFRICDAIVVSCALTTETRHMVNEKLLRSMKHGAALINTARGDVIDEDALAKVLSERQDLRVAADVIHGMETGEANPKRLVDVGVFYTPHIAGETFESRTKAARITLKLLRRFYEEVGNHKGVQA